MAWPLGRSPWYLTQAFYKSRLLGSVRSHRTNLRILELTVSTGPASSVIGITLYILLNWSYTIAVFTDPGSPLNSSAGSGYAHLPTTEPSFHHNPPPLTVKSTGGARYCKKCQTQKPDRAHHCSSCRRCVLKMDHHCPWLATCVGLRNYKPFLLFLVYTTIFCWLCFAITGTWLWNEILTETPYTESLMPINYVMLCTISGIIGIVLTGFTGWHIHLACKNQTTIEFMEKTRYLAPLRRSLQRRQFAGTNGTTQPSYGQQLAEIHANMLPGVTRVEEGEQRISSSEDLEQGVPSGEVYQGNYDEMEQSRERERYDEYLDEQDAAKLPNAFDLGWKRNLRHLFGDRFWLLPICNTKGDGWHWEPSSEWVKATEEIRRLRGSRWRRFEQQRSNQSLGVYEETEQEDNVEQHYVSTSNGVALMPTTGHRSSGKADKILGRPSDGYFDVEFSTERPSSRMSMRTLRRRESFDEVGNDEPDNLNSDDDTLNVETDDGKQRVKDEWRDWDWNCESSLCFTSSSRWLHWNICYDSIDRSWNLRKQIFKSAYGSTPLWPRIESILEFAKSWSISAREVMHLTKNSSVTKVHVHHGYEVQYP